MILKKIRPVISYSWVPSVCQGLDSLDTYRSLNSGWFRWMEIFILRSSVIFQDWYPKHRIVLTLDTFTFVCAQESPIMQVQNSTVYIPCWEGTGSPISADYPVCDACLMQIGHPPIFPFAGFELYETEGIADFLVNIMLLFDFLLAESLNHLKSVH